jgi:hypothetical protein
MKATVLEQATNIINLFAELPPRQNEPMEQEFRKAVWNLCQELRERESGSEGGQFFPGHSIMG